MNSIGENIKTGLSFLSVPFLILTAYFTNRVFYHQGISDFYLNLPFDIILIYVLGWRALIPIYLSAVISSYFVWQHGLAESPLFAIPETIFAASSWLFFRILGNCDLKFSSLGDVLKFILLGLLIPYFIQQILLKALVVYFQYEPIPVSYFQSLLISLAGDVIPLLGISMPLLYFITKPDDLQKDVKEYLLFGFFTFALTVTLRTLTDYDRFWFLYAAITLFSSIRYGFTGTLMSMLIVTLGSFIIPGFFGIGIQSEPEKLISIYLGNSTLLIFSLITGRTISDLRKAQESIKQITEERLKAQQLIIQIQKEQTELLENKVAERTAKIQLMNSEIITQNDQLTSLTESITEQRDTVIQQKKLIQEQHHLLVKSNEALEEKVKTRTNELEQANRELVKNNSQLLQFSYSISHNLRGPLATILGLLNLYDQSTLGEFHQDLHRRMLQSAFNLDSIIRDLNAILDINQQSLETREEFFFEDEFDKLKKQFENEIITNNIKIEYDFKDAPSIESVKSIIYSILYQLFKNSIQYRSPGRAAQILIKSSKNENEIILQITDNGMGIDLDLYSDKVFLPFKRFHLHTEGKGLGLYLVKYQIEMLGGHIHVQSEVNRFTTFILSIPEREDSGKVKLHSSDYADILYIQKINGIQTKFKKPFTSDEFHSVLTMGLSFFVKYNIQNVITDYRRSGYPSAEDQEWLIKEFIPIASEMGLQGVSLIVPKSATAETPNGYIKIITTRLTSLNIKISFFHSGKDAVKWFLNEKVTVPIQLAAER